MRAYDDAMQVGPSLGTTVATAAASANAAIPNDSNGTRAKYVRLSSTVACWVNFGVGSGITASGSNGTTSSILLSGSFPEVYSVKGFDHIAYIQQGSAGVLSIYPLEG